MDVQRLGKCSRSLCVFSRGLTEAAAQSINGSGAVFFGGGGWQEARGGQKSHSLYIEHTLSELDTPGEYYHDTAAHKLYWWPNTTKSAEDVSLVVPTLKRLISVVGGAAPVRNLRFVGLELTHAAPTNMDDYLVPSAGDWSVHRGGAMFLENAENVDVENCTFANLGGNALFLSKHVTRSSIAGSEFVRIGDSAISLVGDAHEINAVRKGDATAPGLFPERNTIELNHIHEVGITGKGMAGIFQSIARSNLVRRNVLYNGPRAA